MKVEEDWLELESVELAQLTKLTTSVPDGADVAWAGTLAAYNDEWDGVSTKTMRKLRTFDDVDHYSVSASDDPIMQDLIREGNGNVFVTDSVITHLMACTRSLYPWDIVVSYLPGGDLFIDAREAHDFEVLTCNETAHTVPIEGDDEDINSKENLSDEATDILHNFRQQVSGGRQTHAHTLLPCHFHSIAGPTLVARNDEDKAATASWGDAPARAAVAGSLVRKRRVAGGPGLLWDCTRSPHLARARTFLPTIGVCTHTRAPTHTYATVQVLTRNSSKKPEPAPLASEPTVGEHPYYEAEDAEEGHSPAAIAYRYRKFEVRAHRQRRLWCWWLVVEWGAGGVAPRGDDRLFNRCYDAPSGHRRRGTLIM